MNKLIYKEKVFKIIGCSMEVHNQLGKGFLEVVYKDALEIEFQNNNIPYIREKEFLIDYKGQILKHKYYADFVVYENIILEVKAVDKEINTFVRQTLNYLKCSKNKLGIIVNFGSDSLQYKRVIL